MLHSTSVLSVFPTSKLSDFKVHIKAKHKRQLIMNYFNMDIEIRFNFEFGNTQRTMVECKSCLPHLSQLHLKYSIVIPKNYLKMKRNAPTI